MNNYSINSNLPQNRKVNNNIKNPTKEEKLTTIIADIKTKIKNKINEDDNTHSYLKDILAEHFDDLGATSCCFFPSQKFTREQVYLLVLTYSVINTHVPKNLDSLKDFFSKMGLVDNITKNIDKNSEFFNELTDLKYNKELPYNIGNLWALASFKNNLSDRYIIKNYTVADKNVSKFIDELANEIKQVANERESRNNSKFFLTTQNDVEDKLIEYDDYQSIDNYPTSLIKTTAKNKVIKFINYSYINEENEENEDLKACLLALIQTVQTSVNQVISNKASHTIDMHPKSKLPSYMTNIRRSPNKIGLYNELLNNEHLMNNLLILCIHRSPNGWGYTKSANDLYSKINRMK